MIEKIKAMTLLTQPSWEKKARRQVELPGR
jgi:hypothetical protein